MTSRYEAVVMGASAGGLEALRFILGSLPDDFPLPIIIVQHRHPNSDDYLITCLNERCRLRVKEADEKGKIEGGIVYIAPPNYHLLIEEDRTFSLSVSAHVNYARPSVDVLFETASDTYGAKLIGVILTGANNDGSLGLKEVKEHGGRVIVQDPETAEAASMPKAALKATEVDDILSLDEIASFLCKLCGC